MTSLAGHSIGAPGRRNLKSSAARGDRGLAALTIGGIWTTYLRQSPAFWFTSFYLFLEYVRPQQIYTSIAFIPWGKLAIGFAFLFTLAEGRMQFRETFLWVMLTVFSLVLFASSVGAYDPSASFRNIDAWIIWLLAITVVAGTIRTRAELILTFTLWCLWNFKMSQSAFRSWLADGFAFRDWGASGAPGWFSNSGEFGIEMCVFFPIVGYLLIGLWPNLSKSRRILLAIAALSAVIGAVASSSRGAVLGLAAIGLWMLLRSPQRVKAGLVVIVLSGLVWIALPAENKKRWSEAGDDKTSTLRIQYWKDGITIANQYPALGIGYKNWMPYYTTHYNSAGQMPHNVFIECVAELGYAGLVSFVMLIGGVFWQNAQTRRLTGKQARAPDRVAYYLAYGLDGGLVGFLASGFFITVLYYPYFWMTLAMTMALSRYAHTLGAPARTRPRRALVGAPVGAPVGATAQRAPERGMA